MKNDLKERRQKAEISIAELSKSTGISSACLVHVEKEKSYPRLDTAFKLAKYYDVNVEDIWKNTFAFRTIKTYVIC